MKQCEICTNREDCKKYNWVITMDKGYKLGKPINELMCDNFNTNKTIEIIYLEVKVNGEAEITIPLPKNLELQHNQRIKKINDKWYKVTYPEGSRIMQEDIKVLEEFIRNYKEVQEKYKDDEIQAEIERSCYFEEVPAQAIENLIKGYKELEERDKERKQLITHLENKICNQKERLRNGVNVVNLNANRMCEVFDLIPKSKVRELLKEIDDNNTDEGWWYINKIEKLLEKGDDK